MAYKPKYAQGGKKKPDVVRQTPQPEKAEKPAEKIEDLPPASKQESSPKSSQPETAR